MFTTRVKPNDIEKLRIEAEYYQPEKMRNIAKLKKVCKKFVTLSELCEFITDGTHQTPTYVEHGVKFLSSKNIGVCEIDFDDTKFVTKDAFDELKRTKCAPIPGDILISKNGKIGTAGVYRDTHPSVGLFVSVALLRYCSDIDSDFLAMYLNSNGGWWQFSRSSKTGVITNLHLEEIREVEVPVLDHSVQKYIGDKVRQAERLRAWAKKCYKESVDLFKDAVESYGYQQKTSKNFVWTKLDNRLDPAYYDSKYSFLDETWFLTKSRPLREFIVDGAYGVLPDSNSYGSGNERFIRATDIRQSNIDPTAFTWVPSDQVAPKAKIKTGDILLEIKGAIAACELAGVHLQGAYVNGSIYRFTPKNIKSGYLAFYLRSFIKQLYCERVSVNNIIAYLDLGSISALPVLRLSAEQEESIEQAFLSHLESARYGFALTKAAKMLVEALIEGQLTESELIAAEQALQAGNDYFDRRILTRLKTDGIDGQGPALLGDLDELYHLLTQAEGD